MDTNFFCIITLFLNLNNIRASSKLFLFKDLNLIYIIIIKIVVIIIKILVKISSWYLLLFVGIDILPQRLYEKRTFSFASRSGISKLSSRCVNRATKLRNHRDETEFKSGL